MEGLQSIVVGLDFSECSRVALRHARRIASWAEATVRAVHVVAATADEMGEAAQEYRSGLLADARKQWRVWTEEMPEASEVELDICVASRLAGIRQTLQRYQADLLIIGAHGEGSPNVGLGTLASACIRSVPTDVLVVRATHPHPFRIVVVGIDFSDTSQRALVAAARVADGERASLHAVHVEPPLVDTYAHLRSDLAPGLESFVRATTSRHPELEVSSRIFLHTGHRSGVLAYAEQVHADLVVVGTKGHTNLHDVVLGSTAEKVLRDSVCAVWAVKPQADATSP
jgi:nucleotide-binding universal stress UspA family protein